MYRESMTKQLVGNLDEQRYYDLKLSVVSSMLRDMAVDPHHPDQAVAHRMLRTLCRLTEPGHKAHRIARTEIRNIETGRRMPLEPDNILHAIKASD